jgi:hypothetical protein
MFNHFEAHAQDCVEYIIQNHYPTSDVKAAFSSLDGEFFLLGGLMIQRLKTFDINGTQVSEDYLNKFLVDLNF